MPLEKEFIMNEDELLEDVYKLSGSPQPHPLDIISMVKINIDSFCDDELMNRYNVLTDKEKWLERCEMCDLPGMLHRGLSTRQEETMDMEEVYGENGNGKEE